MTVTYQASAAGEDLPQQVNSNWPMLCRMQSIKQYCGVGRNQGVNAYMCVSVQRSLIIPLTERHSGYASDMPHGHLYLSRNGLISTL